MAEEVRALEVWEGVGVVVEEALPWPDQSLGEKMDPVKAMVAGREALVSSLTSFHWHSQEVKSYQKMEQLKWEKLSHFPPLFHCLQSCLTLS